MKRYAKNYTMLSEKENQILNNSKVCVVGCGGLGGYIIEMLGRIGVCHITAVDGDVFDETNLNRQLLSDIMKIGQEKAVEAQRRMLLVNPDVTVNSVVEFLDEKNAASILSGHDVIIDALDQIPTRFLLQETCEKLEIPFVHGAIAGWYGQVATIFPRDRTIDKIYKNKVTNGEEKLLGNPSFTPALISSIQVSEVIKILINRGDLLRNKMLFVNTLNQEYEIIDLQ